MTSQKMDLEDLLEAVPDAVVGVDHAGVIRFVNHHTESLFGYQRTDLLGARVEILVPEYARGAHPAHREHFVAAPKARPMGTQPMLSGRRADGTEFPADVALSPMDTGNGMLVLAAVRDMTNHLRAELVRGQLDRLAALVEHSDDAIISQTLKGSITSWNPAAERLFGYTSQAIIGKPARSLIPDNRVDEINSILAKILTGQSVDHRETVRVRKDGTMFPVSLTVSPIRDDRGKITGASTIARDETETRNSIEIAQRMAAIVENSNDSIHSSTLDGIVTSWNPASEKIYGYTSREMIGSSIELVAAPDRTNESNDILTRIAAGQRVERYETLRVRKDGTVFPLSLTVSPIRATDGKITGASVISRDLTQRTRAVDAARSMIEASLDSMVAISPEGAITDANQATVKVTGVPRDELIGTSFSEYFTDPAKAEEIYERVSTEGKAMNHPLTLRHRDGTLTEVLCNASAYHDPRGAVLGVFVAARASPNRYTPRERPPISKQ
jgi:PAS domain S-box-containing protein